MKFKIRTASIRETCNCRSFVVFDTETTGLDPYRDRIIEIGAVRFCDGEPLDRFHSLVDPGIHIPAFITDLTHITDEDVAGAPAIFEVLPVFEAFVGNDALVAHNLPFDIGFINAAGSRLPDEGRLYIDTVKLSRQLIKGPDKYYDEHAGRWRIDYNSKYEIKSHKLSTLLEFYGIEHSVLHRADEDAMMTGYLLLALINDKERISADKGEIDR